MQAIILAAGRGERMRPLTDTTPKPLLKAGGKSLIEYHINALRAAGITDLVINHAHLGEQIEQALGDGARYQVHIQYSRESTAMETGGGIYQALTLLGDGPFLVVNGDIWTDYSFQDLPQIDPSVLAHLVLVDNPGHHGQGDFVLGSEGKLHYAGMPRKTYSGIGIYTPGFFAGCTPGKFPLLPLLKRTMDQGQVTGEYYRGGWIDVGTPQRLAELDVFLRKA